MVQLPHKMAIDVNTLVMSRAYIDPTNATYIDGYGLLNARLSKDWTFNKFQLGGFVAGRNLNNTQYIAFTEPDPDGNSYQPGPMREVFGGLEFRF